MNGTDMMETAVETEREVSSKTAAGSPSILIPQISILPGKEFL